MTLRARVAERLSFLTPRGMGILPVSQATGLEPDEGRARCPSHGKPDGGRAGCPSHGRRLTGRGALCVILAAFSASAATVPWQEGFEGYADNTPLNTLSNLGWGASSDAVVIRTVTSVDDAALGTNAVAMPEGLIASNAAPAEALSNVWVEIYLHASMAMPLEMVGPDVVDPNAAVELFLATNGWPVVWNPEDSAWQAWTQDVWQTDVATFNTAAWVRVTLCQNYSNKTAAVFLNEHLLLPALRFIDTNRTSYARLQLDGGASVTSYFDAASVRYEAPTNWTADLDNDGMLDAQEIQLYGDVNTRHRPVVTVIAPTNGAVTPAGLFDVLPGATTNFVMTASSGYHVAEARTNGQSVGSFLGQYAGIASNTWAGIVPDGLTDATFEAVFRANPTVTAVAPDNGWVTPVALQVYPYQPAGFTFGASNGYYLANVFADGANVGGFDGRYTNSGSYTWPSVGTNGGTVTVEILPNPQVTVEPPANGTVTPASPWAYPFMPMTFTLTASNGYYLANLFTNGANVGSFDGRYTNSGSYTWLNVGTNGGSLSVEILPNPQLTVTPPTNGAVSPLDPVVYPFTSVEFSLVASNGYYVSEVFTNGASVGDFPGRYTASGTNVWPSVDPTGGVFTAAFERKPQVAALATSVGGPSATGGTLGLSASEVFPDGQVTCTMTAGTAYVVSALLTNGGVAATFSGQPRTATVTVSNIWADLDVTAVFTYTASLSVTNDYATIPDALAAALTGDTVVVQGGTYTSDVTLDRSVTLQGTNVTVAGTLGIQGGATGTLAGCEGWVVTGGVTVAAGGSLVVSNGNVDVGVLTVETGGTVRVIDATAFVADGATLTGTFTLTSGWGATVVPQVPPFADPFERYAEGVMLNRMGYFGWAASVDGVVVQTNHAQSGRAVEIPATAALSSSVAAATTSNAWIECYYRDTNGMTESAMATLDVDTNTTVSLFFMTNGYVTVYNPELNGVGGWDVCSNDAWGAAAPTAGDWPRITINRDLARGRAAVFLDGRLLRQELKFVTASPNSNFRVQVDAGGTAPVYLDTYSVNTSAAGVVSDDQDQDGWSDASEIDRFGNTLLSPPGTVFKFR